MGCAHTISVSLPYEEAVTRTRHAIRAETGLDSEDFRPLARAKGLLEPGVKAGHLTDWLTADFDVRPGHAMALISILTPSGRASESTDDNNDAFSSCSRTYWRDFADTKIYALQQSGGDQAQGPITDTAC